MVVIFPVVVGLGARWLSSLEEGGDVSAEGGGVVCVCGGWASYVAFEGGIEGYEFVNACLVSVGLGDGVEHSHGRGDGRYVACWMVDVIFVFEFELCVRFFCDLFKRAHGLEG